MGGGHKALEIGTLWVKIVAACCKQDNALRGSMPVEPSLNQSIILPPHKPSGKGNFRFTTGFILDFTRPTRVPVLTYGLKPFGKDEMEVLNTQARPSDLRDYLFDLAYYVLSEDVRLNEGETIGFSEEQKLPIIRSESAVMDGMTLKIGYPEDYSSH